ncbi:helix-turn-helix domain-containing protein [Labilithrix luteola]|nr:AraC family transcriptional regulator [Labilithrix luteola]
MTNGSSKTLLPSGRLRPWVTSVTVMSVGSMPERTFTRLPNGNSSLVMCVDDEAVKLVAVGPNDRASYKRSSSIPFYARLSFRPGAARTLLGVVASDLANRMVSVDDLWGNRATRLREALHVAGRNEDAAVRVLESVLLERLETSRDVQAATHGMQLAHRALEALDCDDPSSVNDLASRLGVSERRLRQFFSDEIGVSPKRMARIARIRRAVSRVGRVGWARLAADTGFYDQAHLNAEFRALLGVSPTNFARGNLPLPAPLHALRDVCPT